MPTTNLDETSIQILNAASERFLHYGYGKTTMSEIAKDCGMSTGNLYRFFPSKLHIAEKFVQVLRRDHVAQLQAIADQDGVSAPEQIRAFMKLKMRLSYDRFHDNPKAYELSLSLMAERPNIADEWESAEAVVLGEILEKGNKDGCLVIRDPARNTRTLQDAVHKFTSPTIIHEGEFDELSDELDAVIDVLLDGFRWRAAERTA